MLRSKSHKRASNKPRKSAKKAAKKQQKRNFQSSTKPINQQQTTLFGSYGQVGKFVAQYLAPTGMTIIAPYRDAGHLIRDIKVTGDVGQVVPSYFQWNDAESVTKTLTGSDLVINTIGSMENTRHFNLFDANVRTALTLAKNAKEQGVERFIHVSAAGASESAASDFLKAKWESEQAVLAYFPQASIVRPCFTYDVNSQYMMRLAKLASNPLVQEVSIGAANTTIQPTYARDVGAAISQIALHPHIDGQVWTLGGEVTITRRDLFDLFQRIVGVGESPELLARKIKYLNRSQTLTKHFGEEYFGGSRVLNRVTTKGDIEYFLSDITLENSPKTKGFAELGIKPASFDSSLLRTAQNHLLPGAPSNQEKLFSFKTGGLDKFTELQ